MTICKISTFAFLPFAAPAPKRIQAPTAGEVTALCGRQPVLLQKCTINIMISSVHEYTCRAVQRSTLGSLNNYTRIMQIDILTSTLSSPNKVF